jgi:hypothetical protein
MKVEIFLSELPKPLVNSHQIASRISRKRGRPESRYRLSIANSEDVDVSRRFKIPVYLLTPRLVTSLGYPGTFPEHLLLAREINDAVDCKYPRIVVSAATSVLRPTIEDIVVAMLKIDALAARGVAMRNRPSVEPLSLLRKVIQEDVEREATWVNLQEISPAIPMVGPHLDEALLETQDWTPEVVGLRA